jgi:hypothetical protein
LTLSNAAISTDTGLLYCKTHFADQLRTNDGARFATGPKDVAKKMIAAMEKANPGSSKSMHSQSQGGLLQEDLDFLRMAKYDKQLERQVQEWIEDVSGRSLSAQGDGFAGGLSDGVILCYFMLTLAPGSIPQIQESSQPFKQMENIKHFLGALREEFNFAENEVFETMDLREEKNLNQVLQALCTLHRKVGDNSRISHFVEGHKFSVRDMSGEVENAEKELQRRRSEKGNKKSSQSPAKSTPAPSTAASSFPSLTLPSVLKPRWIVTATVTTSDVKHEASRYGLSQLESARHRPISRTRSSIPITNRIKPGHPRASSPSGRSICGSSTRCFLNRWMMHGTDSTVMIVVNPHTQSHADALDSQ